MSKRTNIIKAYTEKMPYGESWFEERRSKCDLCELNTKNRKSTDGITYKSAIAEVLNKISPLQIEGEGNCTLCTCPTYRKCSVKEESCPDGRWVSLASSDNKVEIEAVHGITEVVLEAYNQYNVIFPDTEVGKVYNAEIKVRTKKSGTSLKRIATSCGCLMAEALSEEKGVSRINLTLSTANKTVSDNQNVRLYLYFSNKNLVDSSTQINVKFNVKTDGQN